MALPKVVINIENGALGIVEALEDGVAGLILTSGVAPTGLALGTAAKITSIAEAVALGIDEDFDTANTTHAYRQISEFYAEAGNGAPLWIMVVASTVAMEDICDKANAYAAKLLHDAGGEIRLLGITRVPDAGYTPSVTKGLDDDVIAALVTLQSLANDYEDAHLPFVGIVEGRDYQGVAANLEDLRAASYNHCAVMVAGSEDDNSASVGLLLGRLAAIPVQRKVSRVKDGAVSLADAYLSDGDSVDDSTDIEDIHNKGYIALRKFAGLTGYYFTSDPTATIGTDDYSFISRRRVINKAHIIAYQTYLNEIDEEILVDNATGRISASIVKSWQAMIERNINLLMGGDNGEISNVRCVIDPLQNILSTNKIVVNLYITPVGYASEIEVNIGFENPANA